MHKKEINVKQQHIQQQKMVSLDDEMQKRVINIRPIVQMSMCPVDTSGRCHGHV